MDRRLPRLGSALRWLVSRLLILVVFVFSAGGAVLVHADLPASRRALLRLTHGLLNDSFQGTAEIRSIERFTPLGLEAHDLVMLDPEGQEVLKIDRLIASFDLWRAARKLVFGRGKASLVVDHIRVESAEVRLLPDGTTGAPTIAQAFSPPVETPEPPPTEEGRPIRFWMPRIEIGHAYVRSALRDAPTLEGDLHAAVGSVLVAQKGVALDVERVGVVARGIGGADLRGVSNIHIRSPGPMWAFFDGDFGGIPAHAFVRYETEAVEARLDLPHLEPDAVRAFYPEWPLEAPIGGTVAAQGKLPELDVEAQLRFGQGTVEVRGPLNIEGGVNLDLDIDVSQVDLASLHEGLPSSNIDARGALTLVTGGELIELEGNATIFESEVAGQSVPPIDVRAIYDDRGLEATATLHERGVPARVTVEMPPDGPLHLTASVRKTRLQNSPRLSQLLNASGTIEGELEATIDDGRLDGSATFDVSNVNWKDIEVGTARLRATAQGPLDDIQGAAVDAKLDAGRVRLGGVNLETLTATAEGPLAHPRLEANGLEKDGTEFSAGASLKEGAGGLERGHFKLGRDEATLSGSVESVSWDRATIDVEDLALQSGGELRASGSFGSNGGQLRAQGTGVDLDRIAAALGLPRHRLSGDLTVDADLTIGANSSGYANVRVEDGSFESITGVDVDTEVRFDGKSTNGTLDVGVRAIGELEAKWDLDLAGNPVRVESWKKATGSAELATEEVTLSTLAQLFGQPAGVDSASGTAYVRVSLVKASPDTTPNALFVAGTRGFAAEFEGEGDSTTVVDTVDVSLAGGIDGTNGTIEAMGRVFDYRGDVATVGGKIDTPLAPWFDALWGDAPYPKLPMDAPIRAVVQLPYRKFSQLPAFLRPLELDGRMTARAIVTGTPRDPVFHLSATVRDLSGESAQIVIPLDLDFGLRYVRNDDSLQGSLRASHRNSRIAWGTFDLKVPFENLTQGPPPGKAAWTGEAQLVLDGTPLELLAAFGEQKLRGSAQGSIAISRKTYTPKVRADVALRHLQVADISIGEGRLVAETHDETVIASARFEDEYGSLAATIQATLSPSEYAVTLDESQPISLSLESRKYNAVVLEPFVREVVPELNGTLDGTFRARLTPPKTVSTAPGQAPPEPGEWGARFDGKMTLRDGTIRPSGLGVRLEDASLSIEAGPEGDLNVVSLEKISARVRSEEHNFRGSGKLYFRNLELVRGSFEVEQEKFPVVTNGLRVADITGNAQAELELRDEEMDLDVEIPRLTAELDTSGSRNLIELDDNPDIEVAQPLGPPTDEEEASQDQTPWNMQFKLGEQVRVKSDLMSLRLRGKPRVRYAEGETHIQGTIELVPGGNVTVMGRKFVIREGTIQFDSGDTSNPNLDVTAMWRAANGTNVTVTVRGSAKDPVLNWESDPPLPGGESEIVALVLGGGSSEGGGSGIGYGAAVVNELLGNTPLDRFDFSAQQQTSGQGEGNVGRVTDSTWDTYTVSYQISDELWFEGSYSQETAGFQSQDYAGFSGALDWRFHPDWSLRTEAGQLGVGFDLLWQYRY